LLHLFVVLYLPAIISRNIVPISNFYVGCLASLVCFCGMACIGWASYRFVEKPFLRLRLRYTTSGFQPVVQPAGSALPNSQASSRPQDQNA